MEIGIAKDSCEIPAKASASVCFELAEHGRLRHLSHHSTMKLLLLALAGFTTFASSAAPTNLVAIKAGHLLDVAAGRTLAHQVILVDGENTKATGAEGTVEIPADAKVVDLG